jgi:hypothetical protein
MSAKTTVLESLRRQKELAETEDAQTLRNEWLADLKALIDQLKGWLAEAIDQKLLTIKEERTVIREERIGSYYAPNLTIVAPSGFSVQITPKARFVAGAEGRVDLESPAIKEILVRNKAGQWQLAEPSNNGWTFRSLTEESFWVALGRLIH